MAPTHPLSWADAPPYHYHGTTSQPAPAPTKGEEDDAGAGARSLWIGGLLHWMDEDYLYACFTYSPVLLTLFIKRSKNTGQSEGYGFLKFTDHTSATHILKSYNGQKMPNTDRDFNLNWAAHPPAPDKLPDQDSKLDWATQQDGHPDDPASEYAIFVGDLAYDVTDYMLHHLFKTRYPSVKSAKVIFDKLTGRSKGYGFVRFGDANEHIQAMTEMNGAYCSTRPMRIGPAPNKKSTYTHRPTNLCHLTLQCIKHALLYFDHSTQGTDSYHDPTNSRLFVGCLDQSITDDDLLGAFSPYGELVSVKVLAGKACGFVTYSNRASAEEAMRMLNGSELGGKSLRVSWGRRSGNKQYEQDQQNGGQHGRPKSFDPSGFGLSPQDPYTYAQTGHPGYGYYQQQLPTVQ
ncbi:unnamed protein product [Urochloa humidicola]